MTVNPLRHEAPTAAEGITSATLNKPALHSGQSSTRFIFDLCVLWWLNAPPTETRQPAGHGTKRGYYEQNGQKADHVSQFASSSIDIGREATSEMYILETRFRWRYTPGVLLQVACWAGTCAACCFMIKNGFSAWSEISVLNPQPSVWKRLIRRHNYLHSRVAVWQQTGPSAQPSRQLPADLWMEQTISK